MPIYTYKCNTCGLKEDFMKSMEDFKVQLCPKCSYDPNIQGDDEKMTRIFINVGKPQFKGSGFYETDYKGK
jgi:putative FmdB family regulatory protein